MHNVQPQKRKGKFPSSFLTIRRFFKDNSGFWRCHVILLNIFFQIFKFQCELIELSLTFSENGSPFFPFFLAWNSLFLCVSWHLLFYYYFFVVVVPLVWVAVWRSSKSQSLQTNLPFAVRHTMTVSKFDNFLQFLVWGLYGTVLPSHAESQLHRSAMNAQNKEIQKFT